MSLREMLQEVLMVGVQNDTMGVKESVIALGIAFVIALYLFVVYRMYVRKTLYNINMNISLVGLTVIITAIMLTIQTNLILSLGMVGALSIVRYRTAIKDPLDLLFLFWAIATGIMCGAGQYLFAFLVAVLMTVIVFGLSQFPTAKAPYVLVVNGDEAGLEESLDGVLTKICKYYKVKSRSVSDGKERIIVELRVKAGRELLENVTSLKEVHKASLLTYEGDMVC